MRKILDIQFKGTDELLRLAEKRARLLYQNAETAVANTVLLGVARIANDCPVDMGRARASITGELADKAGVDLQGDADAVAEGKAQSTTGFSGLQGQIGSNVEYILDLEYRGGVSGTRPKLTDKQRRYLFFKGVLQRGPGGEVIYNYKRKGPRGKAFFRKNLPFIRRHFNNQMELALMATKEGRLLREGN